MRKDIQALRGFSILVVLLYHAQFGWLRGGFLGVDIFFVISGFVITTKLMQGEGSFGTQLKEFYLRRAKRILPASLLVTFLTAIFAIFLLPAISRSRFSIEALSSALFSANINFARVGNDYLNQALDPSPYLHYWSLGVEEQFYLLWPILFLAIYRKKKKWILPTLVGTAVFGIWYTSISPVHSFYLPFSRFWEFFAGIFLAMNPQISMPKSLHKISSAAGWLLITFSVLWVTVNDQTPGYTTLIAVFGAMLILVAKVEVKPQFVLPLLGDYSFSLYLVHWPIVVYFLDHNSKLSNQNRIEIVLISILLSILVTQFVEKPFRFKKRYSLSLQKWAIVVLVGAFLSFGVLEASAKIINTKNKIDTSTPITYRDGCHLSFGVAWPIKPCTYGNLSSKTEIILAGDSHAAQWFPALEKIAIERKWKLVNLTKSSCPAGILETTRNGKFDSSCAIWQIKLITKINADKPALVVLSDYTEYKYPLRQGVGSYESQWSAGLTKFLSQIHSPVLFLGDTPKPSSLFKSFTLVRSSTTQATRALAQRLGATYVDTSEWLCVKKCSGTFLGANTYSDLSHISVTTAINLSKRLQAVIVLP
jgi:peptidoglycan/LPS O-acetylase OafA/YrhL